MKKNFALFLFLIFSGSFVWAQNKSYTMQDAVLGLSTNLAVKNIQQVNWIPNTNAFTRVISGDDPCLVKITVPGMGIDTIFRLSEINNAPGFTGSQLKTLPKIHWINNREVYFKTGDVFYKGTPLGGRWQFKKWAELPKGTDNFLIDQGGRQIAYTQRNNVYLLDAYGKTQVVTKENERWIENGQIVSRNEFGIDQGMLFSPKGNYLAFYRMDETKVNDYPIIHWDSVPARNINIKYPMAGGNSQYVTLGVYNPITQKTVFMKTGEHSDHYLTNVTWSPDEQYIYIAILNRGQDTLSLNKYDAKTGQLVKTLFTETDKKYVHPMYPLYFLPGRNDRFLWNSERDGYNHLYCYDTNGKLLYQLTKGNYVVNEINGWNPVRHEVLIATSNPSPLGKNIYAVNYLTKSIRRIDHAPGVHDAQINTNGNYWIDRYSNYTTPRNIRIAQTNGKWEKTLLAAPNTLIEYAQPLIRELKIKAADGKTDLYARLILPPNFDSTKKYPVIVYLYNGPGIQLLHNRFPESGNLWYDYMAQHGYIVFTMDGRGSSNRGLAFEQATFRHLGTIEIEDQLKGVDYLKSLSYVDANRLGVHGWSFGGFMTISLMLRHPGIFKCAVAGGPVIDWNMYEVMYTERYMDRPQENPEGYATASLLDKVKNLDGKLLIIHGSMDSTVVWQQSMKFLNSCIQNGVQVDYFVYPDHPHNVRGKERVHLMQKITDYFDEHLKGE